MSEPPVLSKSEAPAAASSASAQPPLDHAALEELSRAARKLRPIRRACAVAAFSAWTTAVFAGLTLLVGVTGNLTALVMGVGLGFVAVNEFRGGDKMRRLNVGGPLLLAANQALLALLLVGYAAWMLYRTMRTPSITDQLVLVYPELADVVEGMNLEALVRLFLYVLYISVALVGLIVPGLTSLYYGTRRGKILRYRAAAPQWARDAVERISKP